MEWTDVTLQRLRDLWAEGVPTADIARRLDATKNSIVGKAHRLGLTARPSPIKGGGQAKPAGTVGRTPPKQATLPKLISVPAAPVLAIPPPVAVVVAVPPPEPRPKPARSCAWPMWSGGKATHRYCEQPVAGGARRSLRACYCAEHARKARGHRQPDEASA